MPKGMTNYRIVNTLRRTNGKPYACIPIQTHFANRPDAEKCIERIKAVNFADDKSFFKESIFDIYPFSRRDFATGDPVIWDYRGCEIHSNAKANRFKAFKDGHMISNRHQLNKTLDDIDRMYHNQEIRMG